jgi:hypothetical protein
MSKKQQPDNVQTEAEEKYWRTQLTCDEYYW